MEVKIQILFYILMLFLAVSSVYCFWKYRKIKLEERIRTKTRYDKLKQIVEGKLSNDEMNQFIKQSGLTFSFKKYQIIRFIVFSLLIIYNFLFYFLVEGRFPADKILILLAIFLVVTPQKKLLMWKSPFKMTLDLYTEYKKKRFNEDLHRAISQLKNIAIAQKENPPSSDFILNQLRKFTKTTAPMFGRLIANWMLGKKENAIAYFVNEIGTRSAKELGNIIIKLDDLNPNELVTQLTLFQENIKNERVTTKLREDLYKGYGIYVIVAITIFIVLLNFLNVVYFIDFVNQFQFTT